MAEVLECQQLAPFKACGLFGSCEMNGTKSVCECAQGWESSEEMNIFLLDENELEQDVGICNFSGAILLSLYILVMISGVVALVLQIPQITKKSRLRRLTPLLLGLGLQVILAAYRLANSKRALAGTDALFTFLLVNAAFWDWVSVIVYLNKYFKYVSEISNFQLVGSNELFKRHQHTNSIALVFEFFIYQTIWILTVTSKQQKGLIFVKISFGLLGLRALYYLWTLHILFAAFIKDMRSLLILADQRNDSVVSTPNSQRRLEKHIQTILLPRTIRLKRNFIISTAAFSIFMILAAAWDYMLLFYGYLFPVNLIVWAIVNSSFHWKQTKKLKANPNRNAHGKAHRVQK